MEIQLLAQDNREIDLRDIDELKNSTSVEANKYVAKSQIIGVAGVLAGVFFLVTANVLGAKFGRSGLWITMWRSYAAIALLGIFVKIRRQNITIESIKYCLVPSIAFTIHIISFYQAIQDTSLTNVVIIRSLQPALVLFFVGAQFSEKVNFSNIIAAIVAFFGVVITVWGSSLTGANNFRGDLLAVLALGAWVALFIFTKKARVHVGTASFMLITTCLSGFVATVILPFTGQALIPSSVEIIKLIAMAVSASLGHGFISWAHRYTRLTTASLLTLLTPVGSTICAAIFFDQSVTIFIAIGIALVIGSIGTVVGIDRTKASQDTSARLDTAKAA